MTAPRRELPYAWDDIKTRLQDRILDLVKELGFYEKPDRAGMVWPRNPGRNDKKPGSFVIWTQAGKHGADAIGSWKDYAHPEFRGDVFDLIALAKSHLSKMDTYWWALKYLALGEGVVRTKDEAWQARERRDRDAKVAALKAEDAETARSAALFKLWLDLPTFVGAPPERYLRDARGIDLSRLPDMPGALRWAEAVDWVDEETGEVFTWRNCMVSAMTRGKKVTGLHRTFLKPDGSGKREGGKAKTMIGSVRGAAIRLTKGASGLSPSEAAKRGKLDPLVIGEGIETTLTCAVARPDYRAWAAGSLSLMGLLDWPPCASAVILLKDNDWKPEALKAFERVEQHWRSQAAGRPVKVVGAAVGNDFNDWVRG